MPGFDPFQRAAQKTMQANQPPTPAPPPTAPGAPQPGAAMQGALGAGLQGMQAQQPAPGGPPPGQLQDMIQQIVMQMMSQGQ